ncbi:hypothetical protein BKA83DRAFT_4164470 [Pisolithus microcarpus]|nr:hypothetical protein BKA83DRAFT_4164470 [Pisolithus microcarpus]
MSAEAFSLFTMARNKLHAAVGGRDTCNLHRWVLLKNLIFRFQPSPPPPAMPVSTGSNALPIEQDEGKDASESEVEENDSFMFPDASDLVIRGATDMHSPEAEWLDSLLESLHDGGEDEFGPDSDIPGIPAEDDDDSPLSPLASPMSSSDDLLNQNAYCAAPIDYPYPVPYPPFHPPLVRPYQLGPIIESPAVSPPSAYDALPYYDIDELDDLPEAIEDVSDDESDALSTPSLYRSSELCFANPTTVRLQEERRRASSQPHVYIRTTDFCFDRYELDPLPFPDEDNLSSYNHVYQEC